MGEHGGREVRASDRLARGAASGERRVVDRISAGHQQGGHPVGSRFPVRTSPVQALAQARIVVVDSVSENVQVLVGPIDGRDLDRREQTDPVQGSCLECLVDPIHGVVIAECEQLDPGGCRGSDDLGGSEVTVGVAGVRLQVDARHRRQFA